MLIRVSNSHTHTHAHACAHTQQRESSLALGEHLIQKKLQRGAPPAARDQGAGARTLPRTHSPTNRESEFVRECVLGARTLPVRSAAGGRAQRAQARGAKQVYKTSKAIVVKWFSLV
jgi:hypothetical protein